MIKMMRRKKCSVECGQRYHAVNSAEDKEGPPLQAQIARCTRRKCGLEWLKRGR